MNDPKTQVVRQPQPPAPAPKAPYEPELLPPRKTSGVVKAVIALVAVLLVGLLVFQLTKKPADADKGKGANRAVAVSVATVERRDVPVTVEGLGSVTPLATVTIRSLVDGRLVDVAFKEGQAVKKGDLLAQIDPRPFSILLEQATASKQRDEANARNATLNLERYKQLRQQNLIPQQQVDDQAALEAQAKATVALDQAAIDNAKLQLDYARITSPVDGVTGIRQVDPGNIVHQSDQGGIVVITQLDPISIIFTLPQDALPDVSAAMAGDKQLEVQALARDGTTQLAKGKLLLVDNQINAATATLRLKAVFDNPGHALWPNQFVKARLYLATHHGALVVPTPAVQRGPNGNFVYVVTDNVAHVRPVDVDSSSGDISLIAKGVEEKDRVVTEGVGQLKDGAKVQVRGDEENAAPPADTAQADGGGHKRGGGKKGKTETEPMTQGGAP